MKPISDYCVLRNRPENFGTGCSEEGVREYSRSQFQAIDSARVEENQISSKVKSSQQEIVGRPPCLAGVIFPDGIILSPPLPCTPLTECFYDTLITRLVVADELDFIWVAI